MIRRIGGYDIDMSQIKTVNHPKGKALSVMSVVMYVIVNIIKIDRSLTTDEVYALYEQYLPLILAIVVSEHRLSRCDVHWYQFRSCARKAINVSRYPNHDSIWED
jgi:hypothetical protein